MVRRLVGLGIRVSPAGPGSPEVGIPVSPVVDIRGIPVGRVSPVVDIRGGRAGLGRRGRGRRLLVRWRCSGGI